ncbi:CBS domain-containing protein [Asticcacaulis sp. AND118]|uniref:CBS domain-containing protein n=1 Tax=Asticcacaulis sp. AND118 TaxID=2840468 RepID=UPI001CFF8C8A|nr:CBS domain-containing protein [Asticcacaulis sp. AND118]UDF04209.1 CBS domain-containing protein [Asticcacaulis sp. AND118]
MLIKDVMCRDVKIIRIDTPLAVAARLMRDSDCGYLPIGENDRLKGAVTDRDIVVRGLAEGLKPDAPVSEVMTDRIVYCMDSDHVEVAARHMKAEQIRRLAVLDADRRIVGVVSIGDIARVTADRELTGGIETAVAEDKWAA